MNKKVDHSIVIYKDRSASDSLYLSSFVVFLFLAISVIWLIGIFTEFYMLDSGFVAGVLVLSLLAALFGWRLVRLIKSIIDIGREKPQITISTDGIAILGDKLRHWTDIKQIRLVTEFDLKHIALECFAEADNMNYMLYSPFETSEFKNFEELKSILELFTDKVEVSG